MLILIYAKCMCNNWAFKVNCESLNDTQNPLIISGKPRILEFFVNIDKKVSKPLEKVDFPKISSSPLVP